MDLTLEIESVVMITCNREINVRYLVPVIKDSSPQMVEAFTGINFLPHDIGLSDAGVSLD